MSTGKFTKNTTYYTGTVYEWNIPTGSTCPFALQCKVSVNRETGKFTNKSKEYRCYAANAERFPAVRSSRWSNFDLVKSGAKPVLPAICNAVRIHASGDYFNQAYFDMWLEIAAENSHVEFWAYTKSLSYWVNRINDIPNNMVLTASYGGSQDSLIEKHNLKNVIVYDCASQVPGDRPIDTNDDFARLHKVNFALLNNFKQRK